MFFVLPFIVVSQQTIRYDTIRKKSLKWTRKLSIQLNLARVKVKGTTLQWSVGGVLISRTLAFEPVGG